MEQYRLELIDIVVHWYIRFHSWIMAKRDKRVLLKQFKTDLHLEKMQQENISFTLPKSYPINANEIDYIYNVRDRILNRLHHDNYATKQKAIDKEVAHLKDNLETYKNRRIMEKRELERLIAKRKKNLTDDDSIALESNIASAASALQNTDATVNRCKEQIEELADTKKANIKTWQKQVNNLERTIEATIGRYIKNATRKIELTYGYTNYTHQVKKYDVKQLEIIKGGY